MRRKVGIYLIVGNPNAHDNIRRGAIVFRKRIGLLNAPVVQPAGLCPITTSQTDTVTPQKPAGVEIGAKNQMSTDDVNNGQRINCHGVYGTVIGKRSTPKRRFVLVKMDNGFTLKLDADTLSATSGEIALRHGA
jgi:hypothetical protein